MNNKITHAALDREVLQCWLWRCDRCRCCSGWLIVALPVWTDMQKTRYSLSRQPLLLIFRIFKVYLCAAAILAHLVFLQLSGLLLLVCVSGLCLFEGCRIFYPHF